MLEEFRNYKDGFEFSNFGNIRKNGEMVKPTMGEYYYYVFIDGKPERVHTIIGKLFPEICGEWHKYYHYHHLNRNQLDNRAENIVCLSPSEHKKLHQKEDGVSRGVKAYDLNGNLIGEWESKTQAAEETGIDYRHITEIILGKQRRFTAGKLYWFPAELSDEEIKNQILERHKTKHQRYRDEFNETIIEKKKKDEKLIKKQMEKQIRIQNRIEYKKIYEYDEAGSLLRIWDDIKKVSDYYKVTVNCIYSNLRGDTKYFKKNNKKRIFKRVF